jgi:acetoacetyl-CoA synthetase
MNEPTPIQSGQVLWKPSPDSIAQTNLTRFLDWLEARRALKFQDYAELWTWSTGQPTAFWGAIADFFEVRFHQPASSILSSTDMPGARWFDGATLNYAEHALRPSSHDDETAIIFETEGQSRKEEISRAELRNRVARIAAGLRGMGVTPGDRVAGYLSNTPESVIAFLACASVGAIWSNCAAEMSSRSVLDRLAQIAPRVLFASTGYHYGGRKHERGPAIAEIVAGLATLQHVVLVSVSGEAEPVSGGIPSRAAWHTWGELLQAAETPELHFEPVAFEHPLWIVYSSGTTGVPKAIVHGHGGILLEHLKALSLHLDLRAGDRFFWYTTSGWMMWNFLVSGLLLPGVAIVLYDGSPKFPDFHVLWELVARHGVTYFGTSAPYLMACRKEELEPGRRFDLGQLRGLGSTGAPLSPESFIWVYERLKNDLLLGSISGGTDVCSAFVLSNPHLPVEAGKLQCLGLGAKIEAWNENGQPVLGELGELVLTAPFPSMPVFLWNDPDGARMRSSYFEKFPGVWCHGDWIVIEAPAGPCVIQGRSDATLNRGGVRMGTVEFYSIVEALPEIADSLVIDTSGLGQDGRLLLFLALQPGVKLDEALRTHIIQRLRTEASPRHVPDAIYEVAAIPRTLNGKKIEVPLKRIFAGMPADQAVQRTTLAHPETLDFFIALAKTLSTSAS